MASSSISVSWTPPPGRHAVNIGPSLGKALKARKLKASPATTGTTKRSNLPERDFYSFRFNFKPPSIDTTKPASIEIQKSAENIKVSAEYPSAQSGEGHIFLGVEQPAKEVDCVLIYDEDTGTYSLEKLDSFVNLHYDRKTAVSRAPSPIPKAAPPPTQKTTKGKGKQREIIDDLEREIMGLDEDAEGDNDIGMEEVISKPIARKEEEEEEEEEVFKPPKPPLPPTAQPPPPPKARPVKPIPKARAEAKAPVAAPQASRQKPSPPSPPPPNAAPAVPAPPIPAPPRPKPRAVQKKEPVQNGESVQQKEPLQQTGLIPKTQKKQPIQKKEPIQRKEPNRKEKKAKPIPGLPAIPTALPKPDPYVDEEVIEFGRPAKRPRPSTPQRSLLPPTPPPATLALPGGSGSFAPPPPPPGSHNSRGTGNSSRNVPPAVPAALSLPTSVPASPPMMGQYESDEEEWDEVSTANLASASMDSSKFNSNVDDNPTAYELALEQDIFGDVFEEVDGNDEGQATTQQYVDGDGEEEEIDINAFEEELNAHMAVEGDDSDDDIFREPAVEPDLRAGTGQPISLNRLASGGVGAEMSDDEYSSSDDSDDD